MARNRNARPPSSMEFDVAQASASAEPSSYAARYTVSPEGGVVPRTANPNETLPHLRTEAQADGSLQVYIPQLALGTSGGSQYPLMQLAAPPESNVWGDSEYFGMWDTVLDQRDGKWDMRRAIRWWHRDPLVFRCTRFLSQLANSRVNFKSEDADAQKLVETWFKQAMPYSFRAAFFLEFFRTGYVPILKTLIKYEPRQYKEGKIPKTGPTANIDDHTFIPARASLDFDPPEEEVDEDLRDDLEQEAHEQRILQERAEAKAVAAHQKTEQILKRNQEAAEEYERACADFDRAKKMFDQNLCSAQRLDYYSNQMATKQYRWLKGQVPGGYTILDPLLVDRKGPQSMAWLREPYLQVSGDLIAAVMNPSALQKMMLDKLPREIIQQIKDGATYVWLSPNICSIVTQDCQPYERYPVPMMRHAFDALEMKYDIMAMDKATVRGVKNRVLLVKIGNDTYPVTDPATIQNVASIFNSVGRTGTFFWSHAIEMEWIEPDLSSFNDATKYTHCNNEIRTAFGVAPICTGDSESGGAIGGNMVSFKGCEQEVTAAQNYFVEMLEKEVRMLKAALSISADIQIDFERLNLKDEMQFWTVVTQAVMNGIIDHQTALETLGFHFPQIADRMKSMQPLKKKGLFVPSPSANNLGPTGEMKPQGGAGGRQNNTKPPGKNKSKTNKPQSKKKAKASMKAVGSDVFALVETDGLDAEQREDVAKLYGLDQKFVRTTAEFQKQFPDFDLSPEWPQLEQMEMVGATMAAASLVVATENRYEAACEEFKKSPSGGPRGAYLTPQKKAELHTQAFTAASLAEIAKIANVQELPKGWSKHFDTTKKAIAEQFSGLPADHVEAHAFAMTALRFKKSQAL